MSKPYHLPARSVLLLFLISCSGHIHAQQIKGKILNAKSGYPVPNATVGTLPGKSIGIADHLGSFTFPVHERADTFFISSIGYATLKVPVKSATSQSTFYLDPYSTELDPVIIYTHADATGSKSEKMNYFRSWSD